MAEGQPRITTAGTRAAAAYGLMIGGLVLLYLWIRSYGETLGAPPAGGTAIFGSAASRANEGDLLHVLLALVVVIATARAMGSIFRSAGQPQVIGEIIAGIVLGPSLLGRLAPGAEGYLFPATVGPALNIIAQVGVILYMFLVGLELDPALLRKRGHTTVAISHASIIAPFLLGATIALFLYPKLSASDVPFTCFSLFLGVSMSVTAFPVLARILTDRGIHKTRMGAIALTCAAVDDVTAWCMLAFVVGVARAQAAGAVATIAMALGFVALMIVVVRPAMVRLSLVYGNRGRLTQGVMASIFIALLISASATELIGIHAVFGAFALGAVIPHDSGMARELTDRLEDIVIVLLLPAFFAYTGLRTQIGLVSGYEQWMMCALIVVVASAGKFGGSVVAARITGLNWRDSSALGVLMNTRGLMELIVLNIGLEMNVISPTLFAMLVIMALVTTFATTPILHLITRHQIPEVQPFPELGTFSPEPVIAPQAPILAPHPAPHPAPRPAQLPARPILARTEHSAILVPISNPEGVSVLVELALAATPHGAPPPRVLALVKTPSGGVRSGLREADQRVPPRSPALAAALDLALERGSIITPQAVWTTNPAADILAFAKEPQIGWLLLGSHRAVFGSDFMGGVVREILDKARELPVHVAVVIHGGERPLDRVFAVVDRGTHGRAALDLALRVAIRKRSGLHAVLVPEAGTAEDTELLDLIRDAGRALGRRLHTDVLSAPTAAQLARQTPGGLVVIATNLADKVGLSPEDLTDPRRCVVVVQGSDSAPVLIGAHAAEHHRTAKP
ncbi:cation:proton antiporter [Candidatus Binatus sp.]|jgi:Kef-type K+ transport system membrane component KefB|uniref:cation:proton antiporter n=4 Tax=Candidatus Binatus sp. TaxID=2811406 RepID=UPI003C32EC0A